jgi:translation initiation factor 1
MRKSKTGGLVYSTDYGQMCPDCEAPIKNCSCGINKASKKTDGIVRVSRSTKGRGGKEVTCISGIPLEGKELAILTKELKQRCGTGGTIKEEVVEIQGDHRELLIAELQKRGYNVKKAGG